MLLLLIPWLLSLVLALAVLAETAAASDGAKAPPVRSSLPPTVPAPRAQARPVRVVEPDRAASTTRGTSKAAAEKVNINTADVKTLMTLSGVTRAIAQKIVVYREIHGPFRRAAEVRKVDGVGDGVWEKNRARIVTK